MKPIKRKGVGILIITDVPKLGRVACLQSRGYFNTEEMRPQYYSGGCQVTVYSGIKKGETPKLALLREVGEELGLAVKKMVSRAHLVKVGSFSRANEEGVVYAAYLGYEFLNKVRLMADSGGLRLAKPVELKKALDLSKFKSGVKDRFALAVFPDTHRVVKKALMAFRKK